MNVYFDMVGCRLNQAEIDKMALEFRSAGHTIVTNASKANLVVVNTCSVTTQAASDSRQKVRQYARMGDTEVISTGCWSTLQPIEASQLGQGVRVIPNAQKDRLVQQVLGEHPSLKLSLMDTEPIDRVLMPGVRQRTRAFIKVQDGCDNLCTFCITRVARGKGVSRPAQDVIEEINNASQNGIQEVVLTGVHLGSWGQDQPTPAHLYDLLTLILAQTNVPRIRLSSLEPWDLDERFFGLWQNDRMCGHLHLPLQAGSDATLHRMLRKTSTSSFRRLVQQARAAIPNLSITTDLIAGFPGESDQEFAETLAFVEEMAFSGGHVFTYSERDGTPAARIRTQVPHPIRKERNAALQQAIASSAAAFTRSQIGRTEKVLWEASPRRNENGWLMTGYSANYVRVHAQAPRILWNQIDTVKLENVAADGLNGIILPLQ